MPERLTISFAPDHTRDEIVCTRQKPAFGVFSDQIRYTRGGIHPLEFGLTPEQRAEWRQAAAALGWHVGPPTLSLVEES